MVEKATEYRHLFNRLTFTALIIFLAAVGCLIFWGVYYVNNYEGLVTIDAMDLAQSARRICRGDGFTTGFIRPLSLLIQPEAINAPDYYNSPLPALVLSTFFRRAGLTDATVLANSLFWAFLTGVLTLIFAHLLFKNLSLSVVVSLLFFTNLGVVESSFSGLSLSFVSFILLLLSFVYYLRNRFSIIWTVALGIMSGLLYLSECDFLFLAFPVGILVVLDSEGEKWGHALAFLLAFFLTSLPWLIRNTVVAGTPLFSLRWFDFKSYSILFPGNRVARDFDPLLLSTSLPFPVFIDKVMVFTRLMYRRWLSLSYSFLAPFFLVGMVVRSANARWERVKRLVLVLFFSEVFLLAAGHGDFAHLLIFMPAIILSGLAMFSEMLRLYFPENKTFYFVAVIIFCGLNLYPGLSSLAFGLPEQKNVSAVFTREEVEHIRKSKSLEKMRSIVKEDEVVVSDVPWAVAWYGNRDAVWIPWEVDQMKALKRRFANMRFLYLTPLLFKYPEMENVAGWKNIYQSGMIPEWLKADRGLLLPGDDLIMGDILFERLDLE